MAEKEQENDYILPNLGKTVTERFDGNGVSIVGTEREKDFQQCQESIKQQIDTDRTGRQTGRKIFLEIYILSPPFPTGFLLLKRYFIIQNIFLMPQNLYLVWRTCEGLHISKFTTLQINLHILCTVPKFYPHLDYLQNCIYIHKQLFS